MRRTSDGIIAEEWCRHFNIVRVSSGPLNHGWTLKPGPYGRGLKKHVRPDLWAELEQTYTGAGLEENWEALLRTIELMRRVAREVGESLGFTYPAELDQRVVSYLLKVRQLDRNAETFS